MKKIKPEKLQDKRKYDIGCQDLSVKIQKKMTHGLLVP